ncbi:MAG: TonB-dependent receptor [Alphaproteobacteria bacterium]|nr:TonB-dependent receptor [Alphaproteobacteria bacterium]
MTRSVIPLLAGLCLVSTARAAEPSDPSPGNVPEDAAAPAAEPAAPADPPADAGDAYEVTVSAERWEASAQDVPMSVSVVRGETIENAAMTHAEDVIKLTPNVDWVGASNRPRWFLIRGVGDLGTGNLVTNPSVGLLVDEVDLSGVGATLTMLDVERVEVLRGPQGTLYGANALGGLIKVESRAPTAEPDARAEVRLGNYDTRFVSVAGGGAVVPHSDVVTVRVAGQLYQTRGFMDNATLDRHDTAGRNELSTRLRIRIQPTPQVRIDLMGAFVDVDDGYDHWSIDNTRTSYADRPGKDAQTTGMGSMQLRADVGQVRFVNNTSVSSNRWLNTADYDWFGVDTPAPEGSLAADDYVIDLFNHQDTRQDGFTEELRLSSRPDLGPWGDRVRWLVGLYGTGVQQDMSTVLDWFGEPLEGTDVDSTYRRLSLAGFAQVDVSPVRRLTLSAGGRVEHAWQDYEDSTGFDDAEKRFLFGWKASARVELAPEASVYVSASQSSKLGGFNLAPDAPVKHYRPELDRNFELGLRTQGRDGRWRANATGFYIQRVDQQLSEWVQRPGGTSADIFFYTDNADRAYTVGAEIEAAGVPVHGLTLEAALGFLDARIAQWSFGEGEGAIDYSGNRHAHAPWAQFSLSATYEAPFGLIARVGVTGASQRYLANNDAIEWPAYALLDARLGYRARYWGVSIWTRNLTDTTYAAAGFGPYFTPNDHVPYGNFYRYGDPATWGVSVEATL